MDESLTATAFIPVRGGSKGIPGKNLVPVGGRALLEWVLSAAVEAARIGEVVVSTDDDTIADHVMAVFPDVRVVRRSAATASDTASTESAMVEFLRDSAVSDPVVLLQATSPLTTSSDIDRSVELLDEGFDSVVSVVRQRRFRWTLDPDGDGQPVDFDPARRPRRQDHDGFLVENGAIYTTRRAALLASECRVNGRVALLEMSADTYAELDEPEDVVIVDALVRDRRVRTPPPSDADAIARAARAIKLVITDVDGCLTDNGMYYGADGDELKRFSARDGKGFELLHGIGAHTMLLTSESGPIIGRRAEKLRIDTVVEGSIDKLADADIVRQKVGVEWHEVAFLGDDIHDVDLLEVVGLSACPADAVPEAVAAARYRCRVPGGAGAFRELADLVLAARK